MAWCVMVCGGGILVRGVGCNSPALERLALSSDTCFSTTTKRHGRPQAQEKVQEGTQETQKVQKPRSR